MNKIFLLGDSVFDNEVYAGKNKGVIHKLKELWDNVKLLAVDGDCIVNVYKQIDGVKDYNSDYVVLSIGGNDFLSKLHMLEEVYNDNNKLNTMIEDIFNNWTILLDFIINEKGVKKDKIIVSTIYYPLFDDNMLISFAKKVLDIYNSKVRKYCEENNIKLLDINKLFNDKKYYANPIEPSEEGSVLLANEIVKIIKK